MNNPSPNLAGLNLNLLVILDALLAEKHVSRAAARVGLSQPAVSNALAQLRRLLGDPLLVRSGRTMVATERAQALAVSLRAGLAALEGALTPPEFDPATAERTFVIAATDFVEFVLLPRLLSRLARTAPGLRLQLRAYPQHRVSTLLETGDADLQIGFYAEVPPSHHTQTLFDDGFVCIIRRDHPRVGKRLTLKTYASLQHILVTSESTGPGVVDIALHKLGLQRTVGLRTSHFLMVPAIVAETDFVAAISLRVADTFVTHLPLRVLPPPLPLPRGSVGQVWHERTQHSPAHRFLRQLIADVARDV
ncbi:MAG TPA: LysR family transcriptional regulator [Polyangia bacterium]|nr:LysR family transcriptional regulator [Polyangia bacterium]